MPQESRNYRNRLAIFVDEFKGNVVLIGELDTLDSHGSLAPPVPSKHPCSVSLDASQSVKCLHNTPCSTPPLLMGLARGAEMRVKEIVATQDHEVVLFPSSSPGSTGLAAVK